MLTKALAVELAPDLVRVNSVSPTDVMTPMLEYQQTLTATVAPRPIARTCFPITPRGITPGLLKQKKWSDLFFFCRPIVLNRLPVLRFPLISVRRQGDKSRFSDQGF